MEKSAVVGVVGLGNMGGALIEGMLAAGREKSALVGYDKDAERQEKFSKKYKLPQADSITHLCEHADLLVLAVKPGDLTAVLGEIEGSVMGIVSIAAGVTIDRIKKAVTSSVEVLRAMPNTPVKIQQGITFIAPDPVGVSDASLELAISVFESAGLVELVEEDKLNAVTALSGSGPAYLFYFLEALEQAGLYLGLDADVAGRAALQTVLGAAGLAAQTEEDFAALRKKVSSPGGTTVEALKYLDLTGFKGTIVEAVNRAAQKARIIEKE